MMIKTLDCSSNILHVSVAPSLDPEFPPVVLATTAARRLYILETPTLDLQSCYTSIHDSPVLCCHSIFSRGVSLTCSMSGHLVLYDHVSNVPISIRQDHKKYAVKVIAYVFANETYVATAGWDATVHLYLFAETSRGIPTLTEPRATLSLPTNPEDLLFVTDPDDSARLLLIVTRRDSTCLHYYHVQSSPTTLVPLGTQNLAPHSNAWVTFSPSCIALSPIDPSLIAVATSSIPHLKLLIVRLLVPQATGPYEAVTQAEQAGAKLAMQNREDAAIQISVSTMALQTAYSTPMVVWRPDGTGVWVNGEDGLVRGVEASSGKVVQVLSGGHASGCKIRSLWAGDVAEQEWVVSGGFDHRIVVWRT